MSNLCCCEYLDHQGERNHVIACCCNCQDLDEGVEGLITGKGMTAQNKRGIAMTCRDRIRIPWLGGARQLTPDFVLPTILLPSLIILATLNVLSTVIATLLLISLVLIFYKYFLDSMPKFFYVFTIVSIIVLYAIFEFVVISFLLILLEENITYSICLFLSIYFAYRMKLEVGRNRDPILNGERSVQYCNICQIHVAEGSRHRYWLNTCIIPSNQKYYILSLISGLLAFLYSSNLTLTSVCHPVRFFWTILLPDDCSDVYTIMESSLSFVSALYSILLSLFIMWELLTLMCCCLYGRRRDNQRLCFRNICCNVCQAICCYFNQHRLN